MYLKRNYDGQRCTHVQVLHTGTSPEQNFSRRLVMQAISDGWMRLEADKLIVKGEPEDLEFTVLRTPGYYCLSTGERMPISDLAWQQAVSQPLATLATAEAQAWLATTGKARGDYEVTMAYECRLDAAQHALYRAVSEGGIVRPASETQEA
jgi:hypothetical protein